MEGTLPQMSGRGGNVSGRTADLTFELEKHSSPPSFITGTRPRTLVESPLLPVSSTEGLLPAYPDFSAVLIAIAISHKWVRGLKCL
jgi:hypothetical protein